MPSHDSPVRRLHGPREIAFGEGRAPPLDRMRDTTMRLDRRHDDAKQSSEATPHPVRAVSHCLSRSCVPLPPSQEIRGNHRRTLVAWSMSARNSPYWKCGGSLGAFDAKRWREHAARELPRDLQLLTRAATPDDSIGLRCGLARRHVQLLGEHLHAAAILSVRQVQLTQARVAADQPSMRLFVARVDFQ